MALWGERVMGQSNGSVEALTTPCGGGGDRDSVLSTGQAAV